MYTPSRLRIQNLHSGSAMKIRFNLSRKISIVANTALILMCVYAAVICQPLTKEKFVFFKHILAILLLGCLTGIWISIEDGDTNQLVHVLNEFAAFLEASMVFPLFVAQIWYSYGIFKEFTPWPHVFSGLLLVLLFLVRNCPLDLQDLVLGLNALSLTLVSFFYKDFATLAACVLYGIGYSMARDGRDILCFTSKEAFGLFLAGFVYCATESPALDGWGKS